MFRFHCRPRLTAAFGWVVLGLFLNGVGNAQAAPTGPSPQLPTLFVVGDSTARNSAAGAQGWGDAFGQYFDPAKITVLNRARAGRSSRTFVTEGLWDGVLKGMKAGDFVLIQFGHNDGGPVDTGRARASLPGVGEETQEVTTADGAKEVVHAYGWYLRKMVADAKAKGATPIVLSLTVRNLWKDGRVERGSGQFGAWVADVAKAQGVAFVDLTNIVADQYDTMGQGKVKALFGLDYAHTSPAGAELNAASVVAGLKGLKNSPLVNFFGDKAKAVAAAGPTAGLALATNAPARPPLPIPADPALPSLFLIGDSTVRNGQGERLQRAVGVGRAARGVLRPGQDQRREPRRGRPQQPHVPDGRVLRPGQADAEARRLCPHAVRPQRRERGQ